MPQRVQLYTRRSPLYGVRSPLYEKKPAQSIRGWEEPLLAENGLVLYSEDGKDLKADRL